MATFSELLRSITSLNLAASGNNAQNAVDAIKVVPVANSAASSLLTITNASMGQATTLTIPDAGASTASFVLTSGTAATLAVTTLTVTTVNARASGTAGTLNVFPATAANGKMIIAAVDAGGAYNTTISNSAMGQSSVVSIPDPGAATSKFVLQDGTNTAVSVANLKYGATPVAQVDPASCTITAAAGAANTSTITVTLKDGSGATLARSIPFIVYLATTTSGLTKAAAASTGYSVTSGGMSLANGTAVTSQITALSSASGACVLSLLDTGKTTGNLILLLPNGLVASANITSGSYG